MEYDDTGLSQSMKHLIWASLHLRSRETPTGPLPSHDFITSLSAKNRTGWTQTQNILYLYFPLSNVKMREGGETGVNLNEVQSLHLTENNAISEWLWGKATRIVSGHHNPRRIPYLSGITYSYFVQTGSSETLWQLQPQKMTLLHRQWCPRCL